MLITSVEGNVARKKVPQLSKLPSYCITVEIRKSGNNGLTRQPDSKKDLTEPEKSIKTPT